ncbi:MAG TPA: Gldg family protein [Candidatus Competibacteraceae bacterium]|nr:Gldg family protein [Candidatus Competibacteraceae bacterium]
MLNAKRFYSGSTLVVLAVLFIALVMLSNQWLRGARLDLTEQRLYTLADGTRQVLAEIQEPINLYFFFSQRASADLPGIRNYAQRVQELLEELRDQAGGRINLRIIDPLPFSEEEDQATRYGLQAAPVGAAGDNLFFGLAGSNAVDGQAVIPFFRPEQEAFLEYDVAKLIHTLATPRKPVVGVISDLPLGLGLPEFLRVQSGNEDYAIARELEQLFETRTIAKDTKRIDDDVQVLLIVHPRELSDDLRYAIDQFVLRGGNVVAFLDPHSDMAGGVSDLPGLLKAWGVQYDPNQAVLDPPNALTIAGRNGRPTRHPAFLSLQGEALRRDDVITAPLNSLNLASAGFFKPAEGAKSRFEPLLRSSEQAGVVPTIELSGGMAGAEELMRRYRPGSERLALAVRVSGEFESAFPERAQGNAGHKARSEKPANIVLVADSDLLANPLWVNQTRFLGQAVSTAFADNGNLVANALDNLLGSGALVSIRARGTATRPFTRVNALRLEAEQRFLATEQKLKDELAETERKLSELQTGKSQDGSLILSPEQRAELERFQQEKLRIRQELRQVQRQLDADIERLGNWLKLINIGLVPLAVSLAALGFAAWRLQRRRRA